MKDELRRKVIALGCALKAAFFERDDIVDGLLVALLSRQHVLLLGPPGTAKSALANSLCNAIDGASYFQWLLTRYSTPEEVFGPVALSALKNDRFLRVTAGKLPEAHIVFLDEIFKGNSAILNSMLTAVNERQFHNDGGAMPIPLETLVGASNELPEGGSAGELGALYDRFLLRFWVEPIRTDTSFIGLVSDEDKDGQPVSTTSVIDTISLAELQAAQLDVASVRMPRAAAEKMAQLRRELAGDGLMASDRRWKQAVGALRAMAWLRGDDAITEDHFMILSDCMWDDPENRVGVQTKIQEYCGQQVGEALRVRDSLIELIGKLPSESGARQAILPQTSREGKRAEQELQKLLSESTSPSSKKTVAELLEQVTDALMPIRKEARAALGI